MALDYFSTPGDIPEGTVAQLFLETVETYGSHPAMKRFGDGSWPSISYDEVYALVKRGVGGLRALGIQRGDRVGILSSNRPEWSITDYACMCAGVIDVPIYSTLIPEQISYVLQNSGARVVFLSDEEQLDKLMEIRGECGELERVVIFDPCDGMPDWVVTWDDFMAMGEEEMEGVDDDAFQEEARSAAPGDVATMIYTSGTTGQPKGVQLTHNNLHSNVRACGDVLHMDTNDLTLSFLPLSHVFQRMTDYLYFSSGCCIAYARSIHTVAEDLKQVRPTKVNSVPRLYEKVYQKVMDAEGIKAKLVQWAREVGDAWTEEKMAGREPSAVLKAVHKLADLLVYRKIREGVGGRLQYFVSGGAPLSKEINKFFYGAGIIILEGYGLTETSPVTNVNRPERVKIGTVGPPVPGTEIKIADDGEILVRGPQVMKGYYKLPEETEKALEPDGWFHTGDIGELDEEGFLSITDRKKDIIVTAGGKNIAPQPIENSLKKNPFIDQAVMLGDRRKFPALLIVPAFGKLMEWARGQGLAADDVDELLDHEKVQQHMKKQISQEFSELARYEKPKKYALLKEEFTIEGGALTPTQKVKRRVVEARYKDLIDSFYLEENVDKTIFVAEKQK